MMPRGEGGGRGGRDDETRAGGLSPHLVGRAVPHLVREGMGWDGIVND